MGVASGCGEQEVGVASGSGWNLWVWLLGVVVRRYIDFLILLIPTPLVSVLFLQQHPYFLFHFLKCIYIFLAVRCVVNVPCVSKYLYIYIYIYISGCTLCRKCSKCLYVYVNITQCDNSSYAMLACKY